MSNALFERFAQLGQAFTPGSPVNNQDLFAGRTEQINKIFSAVTQRGYHVVLYGERGVGKTSLANFTARIYGGNPNVLIAKVTCDAGDNFTSIWKKAFKEITYTSSRNGIGFSTTPERTVAAVSDYLPDVTSPDDVRRMLSSLAAEKTVLVVLDEYDRIMDKLTSTLVSDTIKVLSDNGTNATLLLIGVADSVSDLIEGHQSIERALVQIPMPRMSNDEIGQIIDKGAAVLGMEASPSARSKIIRLTQGVPYVAHLLGLHCFRAAISAGSNTLTPEYVNLGIAASLDQMHESVKRAYYDATKSHQPGNIYREVLLACALAEVDELGYFTAANVRTPLREITGRPLDIPNFSPHLKQFSTEQRGTVLLREGEHRRWRHRFTSPMMRPYVIMKGHAEGLLIDGIE